MEKLNIIILSKDRYIQIKALIESFYLNLKNRYVVDFTVINDTNLTDNYQVKHSFEKLKRELTYIKCESLNFNDPLILDRFFVKDEFNLVLSDNVVFSYPFDLDCLGTLENDEVLDLFKGVNRVIKIDGGYVNDVYNWGRKDSLYYIENGVLGSFDDATIKIPNHGKIFKVNDKQINDRRHYFFPISPCFINTINYMESIDFYEKNKTIEYGSYALGLRHILGETIDVNELQYFSPNKIVENYRYKFKR